VRDHGLADEAQLHLRGALDDGELLGVAVVELHGVVLHVAGRAEQLERHVRGANRQLGGVVLRHRQVRHPLLGVAPLVGVGGRPVGEQAGGLDVDRELGDLPLDALEVGDGAGEGLPLLHVLGGVHEGPLG
jgi:hypothetical protein